MAHSLTRCAVVFSAIFAAALTACSALAADAERGAELSRRWCAACHLVEDGQQRTSADATPFRTIARARGYDREKLTNFLRDPHGMMPNMALSRPEAEDIVAHIETLAK